MAHREQPDAVYRLVERNEFDESIELSSFAFQMDIAEQEQERFKEELGECLLWGSFIEQKLAAQVQVFPLTVYVQGRKFAMGGVANVASWPEHRRGGLIAELLRMALERMRSDGQTISLLTPFSIAFYRRYGWETFVERKKLTIPSHLLVRARAYEAAGSIVRIARNDAIAADLYERYAARYSGMLSRSASWWKHRIFDRRKGQLAVYLDEAGVHQGYVHYQVKNGELTVHELAALTAQSKRAIWRFIAQHESSIRHVTMYAPADDPLPFELGDAAIEQKLIPYYMARIVDVEAFLNQYPFSPGQRRPAAYSGYAPVVLWLEVRDEHAPWNAGIFRLTVDADGRATVEREEGADAQVSMDIQTLTALMMGSWNTEQLHAMERIIGSDSDIERLSAIIPRAATFFNDFF